MSPSEAFDEPSPTLARMYWTPSRAAGLGRLEAFLPRAGRAYARDRNFDLGPTDRTNVSALSPWIRRRLITEEEVITEVLARHSFPAAEKFIQEIFWRSYWKGWLEMRPGVLSRFDQERTALHDVWAGEAGLRSAIEGRTGIECFDVWVKELVELGWLHNHARMWFASIWIFTLRLPWQLGADFLYKHLLDADPASNTLSWRWVAGLHTIGKHYLARAANIRDKTHGRFDPANQLDEQAEAMTEDFDTPPAAQLPSGDKITKTRVALLLTEEDLHPESWALSADVVGCAALCSASVAAPQSPAARFSEAAVDDGLTRAASHFRATADQIKPDKFIAWAKSLAVEEVVTAYAPQGPVRWSLDQLQDQLARDGIRVARLQRPFDARVWPHARAGYFKLKEKIPSLMVGAP
jgi:hypothetical protein